MAERMMLWMVLCMALAAGDILTESAVEGDNGINVDRMKEANVKMEAIDKGAADDEDDNPGESKESEGREDDDKDAKNMDETEEGDREVEVRLVVGEEDADWERGRVEERQLLASARAFNYNIQVHHKDELPDCGAGEEDNHILVFLPRAEGLLQAGGGLIAAALRNTGAEILLPHHPHLTALAGWARTVQSAALEAEATSLTQLAEHLRRNDELRRRHRAQLDTESRVFHVLDDTSDVGDGGVRLKGREGRYEVGVGESLPPILLARPESAHGRALLLALSDYLTGDQHPEHGCISCPHPDKIPMKVSREMVVVVGVFVRRPQPFLNESLSSLLLHGLYPDNLHFFVHNQVRQYSQVVKDFVVRLRQGAKNVTLLQPSEGISGEADVKNMVLQECVRLGCHWFLHIDSDVFLNPEVPALLLSLGHPILAPAIRVQKGIQASFWRDMDIKSPSPAHSWDHAHLLSEESNARGHWHASCVRSVYAIRHDILARLTTPYSSTDPAIQLQPNATDLAFCSVLRDEGMPMVVTTAAPNLGVMVNTTQHAVRSPEFTSCVSNPILWNLIYLTPTWNDIMTGHFSKVSRGHLLAQQSGVGLKPGPRWLGVLSHLTPTRARLPRVSAAVCKCFVYRQPCDEVYQYQTFRPRFAQDLLRLANKRDQWSPALPQDLRKYETGMEAVPTVDQWTTQLGLDHVISYIFHQILKNQQLIAFPYSMPDEVVHSLVARFHPDEVAGMPSHHDASSITFHIPLTPSDNYQGGELEFPKQKCLLKPELGDVLVFPGRLTHPKIMHNVTNGILHKMIIHIDAPEATGQH